MSGAEAQRQHDSSKILSLPSFHHDYMVAVPGLDLDILRIGRRAGL